MSQFSVTEDNTNGNVANSVVVSVDGNAPKQRIINPEEVLPAEQRTTTAWNEMALGDHLERFLQAEDNAKKTFVFSALFGGSHLYCYPPSKALQRNYWTVVTMGLSGTKMNVPAGIMNSEHYSRCELLCYLPPDWSFPLTLGVGEEVNDQNWPLKMLRSYIQYVSATKAWIADAHGLPSILSDPPGQPFLPSVPFTHVILLETINEPEGFSSVDIDGERVNFYMVVPLTAAEAAWKREVGIEDSLYFVIGSKEIGGENVLIDYVIDPNRKCAVNHHGARERIAQLIAEEEEREEDDNDNKAEEEDQEDEEEKDENDGK